jgi:MSHA biogenesis protein MshM
MYLQHFGLQQTPFSLTPDTEFFMYHAGYQDALNVLLVALRSGEGFIKVTGEVGTGKTLLCRKLMKTLGEDHQIAYLPNPCLGPEALLLAIAEEIGVSGTELPDWAGRQRIIQVLNQTFIQRHAEGKRVMVLLDEAQAMPIVTLETLRLLTNLETEKYKLVQVVLFGQPELDQVLADPCIRQLRQRITFSYQLCPLNRPALAHYIDHRLQIAGYQGEGLFDAAALDLLYRGARGIPRLANILAHKSLMVAYGEGGQRIERRHVQLAIADTTDARSFRAGPGFVAGMGGLLQGLSERMADLLSRPGGPKP